MREIKFRAWDGEKFTKEEFYVQDGKAWILDDDGGCDDPECCGGSSQYMSEMNTWEVEQFTGLVDKNGREIYEGDIVSGVVEFPQLLTWDNDENSSFKMGGVVIYDHSTFTIECKNTQKMCDPRRDGMVNYFYFISDDGAVFTEIEVVGNIYENPEFLNQ